MAMLGGVEAVRRWRSLREAMSDPSDDWPRRAMKSLEAQKLAELVGSPFAAQLIGAMPEPAVIVSADERAAAANKPALDLLPGLRIGDPFVLGLRAPDVIDARRRVMASGEAETVQWSERVPVERLFEVYRRAARDVERRSRGDAHHLARSDRGPARRAAARRLHRQRQSRVAHAARLAARLHRDPAGLGAR